VTTLIFKRRFTERYLPSPFSKKSSDQASLGAVEVTNSTLICEKCFETTGDGVYYPAHKVLSFTCPNGHVNEVRNIEI
jgi:hypothetical protein